MSDWRDDLPPIPSERIRRDVIREGHRRREQRRQRHRAVLYGAMGAAAVSLIVVAGLSIDLGTGGDDDDAATDTVVGTDAQAGTELPQETTAETDEAAATTAAGAAETTTADTEATADTMVPHTTIGGPIAVLPPSEEVSVDPTALSEQGSTPSACGPSSVVVTYRPRTVPMGAPVVHWETARVAGEAPMFVSGDVASATLGSFPADTLDTGVVHELLVWVTDTDAAGAQFVLRAPTVLLRDCSR